MEIIEKPIFIVGSPRSGTTLLRLILSSHPRIYIPEETGFIPFLLRNVNRHLTQNQTGKIIQRVGRLNYLWHGLVDDMESFYKSLPEPTLRYVLDSLYKQIIKPFGAERWGDKTPLYIRFIPKILSIFPDAQFIHILRDGRDCTISSQRKWGSNHRYMDNYYLLKNWVINVEAGLKIGRFLPKNQYIEIKYEELVLDPSTIIHKICEFIQEDYSEVLLDHIVLANYLGPGPNQHTEVLQPINKLSVYRWRNEMSLFDIKMSDYIAGSTLSMLGYELGNVGSFTMWEWAKISLYKMKYLFSQNIRNLLYALNVFTLNRNMRRRIK